MQAQITDPQELTALVGEPAPAARDKVQDRLTEQDRGFLAAASLCFVATVGDGGVDVSPKGDPAGALAHVLDERTLALPERAGNRRVDGFHNLLQDDRVGLIFLVPGVNHTLRVNGRGRLVTRAPFLDDMVVRGHRPLLALMVHVEEVFNHCPKAFMRSGAWDPDSWEPQSAPGYVDLAKAKWRRHDPPEQVEAEYAPQHYAEGLYPSG